MPIAPRAGGAANALASKNVVIPILKKVQVFFILSFQCF
jgi:hypothetical protein